jgi:hypothetical protein
MDLITAYASLVITELNAIFTTVIVNSSIAVQFAALMVLVLDPTTARVSLVIRLLVVMSRFALTREPPILKRALRMESVFNQIPVFANLVGKDVIVLKCIVMIATHVVV